VLFCIYFLVIKFAETKNVLFDKFKNNYFLVNLQKFETVSIKMLITEGMILLKNLKFC